MKYFLVIILMIGMTSCSTIKTEEVNASNHRSLSSVESLKLDVMEFSYRNVAYVIHANGSVISQTPQGAVAGKWANEIISNKNILTLNFSNGEIAKFEAKGTITHNEFGNDYLRNILQLSLIDDTGAVLVSSVFSGNLISENSAYMGYKTSGGIFIIPGEIQTDKSNPDLLRIVSKNNEVTEIEGTSRFAQNASTVILESDRFIFTASSSVGPINASISKIVFDGHFEIRNGKFVFVGSSKKQKTVDIIVYGKYQMDLGSNKTTGQVKTAQGVIKVDIAKGTDSSHKIAIGASRTKASIRFVSDCFDHSVKGNEFAIIEQDKENLCVQVFQK